MSQRDFIDEECLNVRFQDWQDGDYGHLKGRPVDDEPWKPPPAHVTDPLREEMRRNAQRASRAEWTTFLLCVRALGLPPLPRDVMRLLYCRVYGFHERVYVFGGFMHSGDASKGIVQGMRDTLCLNLARGTCDDLAPFPGKFPLVGACAVAGFGDEVLLLGGTYFDNTLFRRKWTINDVTNPHFFSYDIWVYTISTDKWRLLDDTRIGHFTGLCSALLYRGLLWLTGEEDVVVDAYTFEFEFSMPPRHINGTGNTFSHFQR